MMAKVNILRYVHLLNQFRVNKGCTHVQYFVYCITLSIFFCVTRAHNKWRVLNKHIAYRTGLQQCTGSSHSWILIYIRHLPPTYIDTEIERGYQRRNHITPRGNVPNLGSNIESYIGGSYAWHLFKKWPPLTDMPHPPLTLSRLHTQKIFWSNNRTAFAQCAPAAMTKYVRTSTFVFVVYRVEYSHNHSNGDTILPAACHEYMTPRPGQGMHVNLRKNFQSIHSGGRLGAVIRAFTYPESGPLCT